MIVANATFETRALLGVGDFAYSACSLSARTRFPVSDSFSLVDLSKHASMSNDMGSILADRTICGPNASTQLLQRFAAGSISLRSFSSWDSDSSDAGCTFSDASSPVLCVGGGMSAALSAHFISLLPDAGSSFTSGGIFSVPGFLSASDWHFLPNSAAAITISAPWYRAYARKYTNLSYYASCRCGAGHSFTGACALPLNFRRALRL